MLESIAKELMFARKRNGLSIKDVAKSLNLCQMTIRRYETNCSGLTVERLEELLEFYKVDRAIFFRNISENMHIYI